MPARAYQPDGELENVDRLEHKEHDHDETAHIGEEPLQHRGCQHAVPYQTTGGEQSGHLYCHSIKRQTDES